MVQEEILEVVKELTNEIRTLQADSNLLLSKWEQL